jgi:hypothetical protein
MLHDEIPDESDIFCGNRPAPVPPLIRHLAASMAEPKLERKSKILFGDLRIHAAPHRRGFRFRIPGRQQ